MPQISSGRAVWTLRRLTGIVHVDGGLAKPKRRAARAAAQLQELYVEDKDMSATDKLVEKACLLAELRRLAAKKR